MQTSGAFRDPSTGLTWNWSARSFVFQNPDNKTFTALDFFENRSISTFRSGEEAQQQVDAWNRQARVNFVAGLLSGYSIVFEFTGAAKGMGAETNSEMFAMGQRAGTGASIAGAATGVGLTNALISRLGRGTISILKEIQLARNTTVLGKVGSYEKVANALGANYFHVADEVWNAMSDAERWGKNQAFLDQVIERGDDILLANKATNPTGFYKRELEYLFSKGYKISEDGTRLIRP